MHARAREIVEEAKTWVDVKYRHRGRDRVKGVDCAGLWIVVMNVLGIRKWDTAKYSRRPCHKEFRDAMLDCGCRPLSKLEHGAICRVEEKNWAVHTVIYELDEDDVEWIIHAWAPAKKVVRERLTHDRKLRIQEIMRFPE